MQQDGGTAYFLARLGPLSRVQLFQHTPDARLLTSLLVSDASTTLIRESVLASTLFGPALGLRLFTTEWCPPSAC
jgi:hypothetical protein